jgi:hypothetical protein
MPSANFEAAAKAAKQLKAKPTDDELLQVGLDFPKANQFPLSDFKRKFNGWAGCTYHRLLLDLQSRRAQHTARQPSKRITEC